MFVGGVLCVRQSKKDFGGGGAVCRDNTNTPRTHLPTCQASLRLSLPPLLSWWWAGGQHQASTCVRGDVSASKTGEESASACMMRTAALNPKWLNTEHTHYSRDVAGWCEVAVDAPASWVSRHRLEHKPSWSLVVNKLQVKGHSVGSIIA